MGKITAFVNQKGGVGKTTVCVNLAACLAGRGTKVLVVDVDPQGNATASVGCKKNDAPFSVYDVILGGTAAENAVVKTPVKGLFLLPSSIDLVGAEVELVYLKNYEKRLISRINGLKDDYDFIFIDCPPSLGILTLNALAAADGIITPALCEYFSLLDLGRLTNTVKIVKTKINPALTADGVIINMYDGRSLLSREIYGEIRAHFGEKVFDTVIPKNVKISESPGFGVPVTLHDNRSRGALAFETLAEEFLAKCN
ncbi:MAG: ParA family protein [Clostridia bacterium]|nr:ParA family protein [Clostridia bacterium]